MLVSFSKITRFCLPYWTYDSKSNVDLVLLASINFQLIDFLVQGLFFDVTLCFAIKISWFYLWGSLVTLSGELCVAQCSHRQTQLTERNILQNCTMHQWCTLLYSYQFYPVFLILETKFLFIEMRSRLFCRWLSQQNVWRTTLSQTLE